MKRRKDAAEAKVERKRKARHDKACKLARAEGKPQPATPESSEEDEEEASDAEDHALRGDGEGAGASPPPFYLWDEDEGEPAAPEETRAVASVHPSLEAAERESSPPAAGEETGARGADPWRRGCGGRGVVRVASLESPGRHEGGALGAVFEGWLGDSGSKKRHEEAEHERSLWVSELNFVFVACLVGFSILLSSTRVS